MILPGMLVCSSFLISVGMFIVSKALLISNATLIVRAGGAISLNPFATVLFSVCSAATIRNVLGVVAILLLNVMDVFSVCGGALLDRPCMVFQRVCVLCL